jgi:hypothetical protein
MQRMAEPIQYTVAFFTPQEALIVDMVLAGLSQPESGRNGSDVEDDRRIDDAGRTLEVAGNVESAANLAGWLQMCDADARCGNDAMVICFTIFGYKAIAKGADAFHEHAINSL